MWLFIHLIYIVEFRGRILVFVQCGFEYPTFSRGARLIVNSDATYILKVDSSYELPWRIGTSVNFQYYTGLPIQPVEIFGVNGGLTQGTETVILRPARITRLPSVNMLNVRLSREFVLNDRWHMTPLIDFFNLTSAQTTVGENNFFDADPANNSYLKPFLTIDPFVTRFGLRFTF